MHNEECIEFNIKWETARLVWFRQHVKKVIFGQVRFVTPKFVNIVEDS